MNKTILAKTAAMLLAACLTLGLTACGGSDSSSKAEENKAPASAADSSAGTNDTSSAEGGDTDSKDEPDSQAEVSSEEETVTVSAANKVYHTFDFMLPDGWDFAPDTFGLTGEENPGGFTVSTDNVEMYIEIIQETDAENRYDNRITGNTEIPPAKPGEIEWKGLSYDSKTGFEVYGDAKGNYVYVTCTGLTFDSPEAQTVLGSMKQWEPTELLL